MPVALAAFSAIDLTGLPPPDVVETLSFEAILAEMIEDLRARDSTFDALLESDPGIKLLEVAAYREMLLRARINDASVAVMLAFAAGADLDNLAATFSVVRQVVDPGDSAAIPPRGVVYESDNRFRERTALALEGLSVAGPVGAYVFHALSASGTVKNVSVDAPEFEFYKQPELVAQLPDNAIVLRVVRDAALVDPMPGDVAVSVLSVVGDGVADDGLVALVADALNDVRVRPLTDHVIVRSGEIISYALKATLYFYDGPDLSVVMRAAQNATEKYVADNHRLGRNITISGLHAALHQTGVSRVDLASPGDIIVALHQAAFCTDIEIISGGVGE